MVPKEQVRQDQQRIKVATNLKYDLKIFITNKCNQKCAYCFERDTMHKLNTRINKETINDICRFVRSDINMINSLNFLGGETFLNIDDIDEILTKLYDLLVSTNIEVCFFTNGMIFNDKVVSIYKKFSKLNLFVYISDHNMNLSNESSTTCKHLQFLIDNNINYELRLIFDSVKLSHPDKLNEYFTNTRNKSFNVNLFPAYFDKYNIIDDKMMESFKSWCADNISNIDTYLIRSLLSDVFKIERIIDSPKLHKTCDHCGAGVVELAITTNGTVLGCEAFMDADDLEVINVSEVNSIAEIRSKSPQMQYLLKRFNDEPEKCNNCRYRVVCTNCRYNFTMNTNVYSEKPNEICNFMKLMYHTAIDIASLFFVELHKRSYKEHIDLLDEIKLLHNEVIYESIK